MSKMLINFLHPSLQPEVRCSSVATDGYEISNLISSDSQLSDKGFLAERFISGPVEIKVKLLCPVDVQRIVIWTKVSNQKSLGFELSSARKSSFIDNEINFRRFASVKIPNHVDGIVLEKEGQRTIPVADDRTFSFHRSTFYRGNHHENVVELLVKIFKFQFVPALKKIEIWGQPHKFCDRQMKRHVYSIWNRNQKKFDDNIEVPLCIHVDNKKLENPCYVSNDSIPEEFCDEITHEMMTLPMVLPSGKIVDYRTLEKFQDEEVKWGRPPSDPFTGRTFTAQRKPVVATSLKLNIDSFCARNPNLNDVKMLARRLGSRESYNTGVY